MRDDNAGGLTNLRVIVNGLFFELARVDAGESRDLDVGVGAARAGANSVVLEALGKPRASATALIADR